MRVQGGEDPQDASALQRIFRKKNPIHIGSVVENDLQLIRDLMGLCYGVATISRLLKIVGLF